MKILVTGHKGFIGSRMVKALSEHQITTCEWGERLPIIHGFDWVVHIGAISSTTERDVDKVMRQNYDFSVDLYESCMYHGVNFQFSSSASIYGLGTEFNESSPVDPRTPYAWSKYMFERYMMNNQPTSSVAQAFRYFNVYGPDGEEHKGSQASPYAQFKKQAEDTGRIQVFEGSENFLRDFVPVNDVIDLHKKFFNVNETGVWNVGTGTATSFRSVAESFGVEIVDVPMPPALHYSYQRYTCADMSKTLKTLQKYNI